MLVSVWLCRRITDGKYKLFKAWFLGSVNQKSIHSKPICSETLQARREGLKGFSTTKVFLHAISWVVLWSFFGVPLRMRHPHSYWAANTGPDLENPLSRGYRKPCALVAIAFTVWGLGFKV